MPRKMTVFNSRKQELMSFSVLNRIEPPYSFLPLLMSNGSLLGSDTEEPSTQVFYMINLRQTSNK